ncbi:MAG: exodeoxyribonuclease VII small subunit [Betaproteobacteria bacterium]|nr:exodeoxyribonuclease VII small subunit [Betaproteobacteria bacterium]
MVAKKTTPAADAVPPSYEAALEELGALVAGIEDGSLSLEATLAGYQRGAFLLNFCRDKLAVVEQQVKVLEEGALKPLLTGE